MMASLLSKLTVVVVNVMAVAVLAESSQCHAENTTVEPVETSSSTEKTGSWMPGWMNLVPLSMRTVSATGADASAPYTLPRDGCMGRSGRATTSSSAISARLEVAVVGSSCLSA